MVSAYIYSQDKRSSQTLVKKKGCILQLMTPKS